MQLGTGTKLSNGFAVADLAFCFAMFTGPLYARYFWLEAAVVDSVSIAHTDNVVETLEAVDETADIAATANQLTGLGN